MDESRKAGSLILNSLGMFNAAACLLDDEITGEFVRELQDVLEHWCEENDWEGEADWNGKEVWVSPLAWKRGANDYTAYCSLDYENVDQNSYDLANFCGCGETRIGFWVIVDYSNFCTKPQWKKFCANSLPESAAVLRPLGFDYDANSGCWFLPVTIASAILADAYASRDYSEALAPVNTALERLRVDAVPILDEVINAAKQAFPAAKPLSE